jgi:hypothetical protein
MWGMIILGIGVAMIIVNKNFDRQVVYSPVLLLHAQWSTEPQYRVAI